jgi:hypothetical protein
MGVCLTCAGALVPGDVVKGGRGIAEGVDSVQVLYRQGEAGGFLGQLSTRAVADRGPLTRWGKRSFVPPITIATVRTCIK